MALINLSEVNNLQSIITLGALIIAVTVGFLSFIRSKNIRETIDTYKELTEAQDRKISLIQSKFEECVGDNDVKHKENAKKISNLQGQIDVLKTIPLSNILKSLTEHIKKEDHTGEEILKYLKENHKLLKK